VKVECLAQNTTQGSPPGLKHRPLDLEVRALTMRLPRHPLVTTESTIFSEEVTSALAGFNAGPLSGRIGTWTCLIIMGKQYFLG